jgi:hypothetical protein
MKLLNVQSNSLSYFGTACFLHGFCCSVMQCDLCTICEHDEATNPTKPNVVHCNTSQLIPSRAFSSPDHRLQSFNLHITQPGNDCVEPMCSVVHMQFLGELLDMIEIISGIKSVSMTSKDLGSKGIQMLFSCHPLLAHLCASGQHLQIYIHLFSAASHFLATFLNAN